MTTDPVVRRPKAPSRLWIVPVLLTMLAYPALRVLGTDTQQLGIALLYGGSAYLLAFYLFYGIARIAFESRYLWLTIGAIGGVATGLLAAKPDQTWFALVGWGAVLITGSIVGRRLAAGKKSFEVFIVGTIILTLLTAIAWFPTWQDLHAAGAKVGDEMVREFEHRLAGGGYSSEQVEQLRDTYRMLVSLSVRLAPASTIVSAIVQLSLGFLWLIWRVSQVDPAQGKVRRFIFWKVPFALTPVTGIAIVARLVGNDQIQLIADNALLVLAIFYSVCGLAFMEFTLHRFKASLFIRILFYLLLFLTQIAGLLVMVLLGFIDSFVDWRKVTAQTTVEQ